MRRLGNKQSRGRGKLMVSRNCNEELAQCEIVKTRTRAAYSKGRSQSSRVIRLRIRCKGPTASVQSGKHRGKETYDHTCLRVLSPRVRRHASDDILQVVLNPPQHINGRVVKNLGCPRQSGEICPPGRVAASSPTGPAGSISDMTTYHLHDLQNTQAAIHAQTLFQKMS